MCWSAESHFILCPFTIQEREPYLCDFIKKNPNLNIDLCSEVDRLVSFKLGMIIETAVLYILVTVWMTLTFIQGL